MYINNVEETLELKGYKGIETGMLKLMLLVVLGGTMGTPYGNFVLGVSIKFFQAKIYRDWVLSHFLKF